jgi:hypothetical protein
LDGDEPNPSGRLSSRALFENSAMMWAAHNLSKNERYWYLSWQANIRDIIQISVISIIEIAVARPASLKNLENFNTPQVT